jgi:hypothetical protein
VGPRTGLDTVDKTEEKIRYSESNPWPLSLYPLGIQTELFLHLCIAVGFEKELGKAGCRMGIDAPSRPVGMVGRGSCADWECLKSQNSNRPLRKPKLSIEVKLFAQNRMSAQ